MPPSSKSQKSVSNGARVVIVTGMSGAGKSSALGFLEDAGFEAVDNIPVSLLGRLLSRDVDGQTLESLAVGLDIRTRDFHAAAFSREIAPLMASKDVAVSVLFLDCGSRVLGQRFTQTRRKHPLATDRPVMDGIQQERELMAPVREAADLVIDTSELTLADLRNFLERKFSPQATRQLTVSVVSFAYGRGLPREADLVFDVRFLTNPHYVDELRAGTGLDSAVAEYVVADPAFAHFFESLTGMLDVLMPRYLEEGKSYLTIAVGCTGGRHRSVFTAQRLSDRLRDQGWRVFVRHRELDILAGADHMQLSSPGS
jgi:UPF0042 nucleotide-binding protein